MCKFGHEAGILYFCAMKITRLSKTKGGVYATLGSAKMRRRHGLFLAEGEKLVADTRGAFVTEALVALPEWFERHPDTGGFPAEVAREATEAEIARISSMTTPPEVLAVYRIPESVCSRAPEPEAGRLTLVLDGIQDPGNLGTIVRTADWFGVYDILASPDTADIYNPKAVQATMGAISRVHVCYCELEPVIRRASERGVPVYGTLLEGENMYDAPLTSGGLLVMGNEGKGISRQLRPLVTEPLLIPPFGTSGHGESLNVAAATAITLAEFRRRLAAGHRPE